MSLDKVRLSYIYFHYFRAFTLASLYNVRIFIDLCKLRVYPFSTERSHGAKGLHDITNKFFVVVSAWIGDSDDIFLAL